MSLGIKKYPMYYAGVKQPYSKSVVVGNLVYCAGMDGAAVETGRVSLDDVAGQTVVALDKVKDALKEAGTSMDNIVRTVILLKNMEDYERVRETELKYYNKMRLSLLMSHQPVRLSSIIIMSDPRPW